MITLDDLVSSVPYDLLSGRRLPAKAKPLVEEKTRKILEFKKLHLRLAGYNASTLTGKATVYRSLVSPPFSLEEIHAKQDALREMDARPELRAAIEGFLRNAGENEDTFLDFLRGNFKQDWGIYDQYEKTRQYFLGLVEKAHLLPRVESTYLDTLITAIQDARESEANEFMEGPVLMTFKGLRPRKRVNRLTAMFSYRPTKVPVKPIEAAITATTIGAAYYLTEKGIINVPENSYIANFIEFSPLFAMIYLMLRAFKVLESERENFFYPLSEKYRGSQDVHNVLESIGRMDELLCFMKYRDEFPHEIGLPEVVESERHFIEVKNARHPVLAYSDPDFVPNDISLNGQNITFISGPNSGGKTTLCSTLTLTQALGQIGCYTPGEARISIADQIHYQTPEFASTKDAQGRFGKEWAQTGEIFYGVTPKSLVILDELAEGTTYEEKLEQSKYILKGFEIKGNNTILVTHNHALIDQMQEAGIGVALMTKFKDGKPTFSIVPGISRISHAKEVAEKVGASKQDVIRHLIDEGYLPPGTTEQEFDSYTLRE